MEEKRRILNPALKTEVGIVTKTWKITGYGVSELM